MNSIKNSAENFYKNDCELFFQQLANSNINLEISYEAEFVKKPPVLCVKLNNKIVYENAVETGIHSLHYVLETTVGTQILQISMHGKDKNSTIVDNGVIVKDTFIKLMDLKINKYKILDDHDFFHKFFKYKKLNNNTEIDPMNGFWEDSVLELQFQSPFDLWYNKISTANSKIADSLLFNSSNNLEELVTNLEASLLKLK